MPKSSDFCLLYSMFYILFILFCYLLYKHVYWRSREISFLTADFADDADSIDDRSQKSDDGRQTWDESHVGWRSFAAHADSDNKWAVSGKFLGILVFGEKMRVKSMKIRSYHNRLTCLKFGIITKWRLFGRIFHFLWDVRGHNRKRKVKKKILCDK